jgi:H+/Cl- antiporter ClcA
MYGLFLLGGVIGAVSGVVVKVFKIVLEKLLEVVWVSIPEYLISLGWQPTSSFGLWNYTWMVGASFGMLVGALSGPLLDGAPATTLGAWVGQLHKSPNGCAAAGPWLGGLVTLGLLTALSGAAVGPEPVVVIVPSVLAGAFTSKALRQPSQIARAAALAGGAGGLGAFFGLPIASAFMVLEVPNIDGAQFALEALPACAAASIMGTVFGDCIWHPSTLLAHSRFWFPGGDPPGQIVTEVTEKPFGLGAVAFAGVVGLLGGTVCHLLVAAMKGLHPFLARLKTRRGGRANTTSRNVGKRAFVLAIVGALNGALSLLYPSALFWGEAQLQVVLTRGCKMWHGGNLSDCHPVELPHFHDGLVPPWAIRALPGKPMDAWDMLGLTATKFAMIAVCEAVGFVGGAIYPVIFLGGALGSAFGALPAVGALGGQYVYLSTAAPMAVAVATLLNANLFAV